MGLIKTQATTIYVEKDEKGNTIITPEQKLIIDNFQVRTVKSECPACDGDGIVGCEYCDICPNSQGYFYYTTELKIVPLLAAEKQQLQLFSLLRGGKKDEAKKLLDNFEGVVFGGTKKDWKAIPKNIQAISVCSQGKVSFYSQASGIYTRYDDEHSSVEHRCSQHWYYGVGKKSIDITKKNKNLNLVIKADSNSLFIRPGAERITLDFASTEPFDWGLFPKSITRIYVVYGDMNIDDHAYSIYATSDDAFLRGDNVCWERESREEKEITLLTSYGNNEDTGEYPVFKKDREDKAICVNEMNFILKNLPLKTLVYELPEKRKTPVPIQELKMLDQELCEKLNKNIRPIDLRYSIGNYPLKYDDHRSEIELWFLSSLRSQLGYGVSDYDITEDGVINVQGEAHMKCNEDELKYKFGTITGRFSVYTDYNSDGITSLKNFPDSCGIMYLHSPRIKNLSGCPKTLVHNQIQIGFCDTLKSTTGAPDGTKIVFACCRDLKIRERKGITIEHVHSAQYLD